MDDGVLPMAAPIVDHIKKSNARYPMPAVMADRVPRAIRATSPGLAWANKSRPTFRKKRTRIYYTHVSESCPTKFRTTIV